MLLGEEGAVVSDVGDWVRAGRVGNSVSEGLRGGA